MTSPQSPYEQVKAALERIATVQSAGAIKYLVENASMRADAKQALALLPALIQSHESEGVKERHVAERDDELIDAVQRGAKMWLVGNKQRSIPRDIAFYIVKELRPYLRTHGQPLQGKFPRIKAEVERAIKHLSLAADPSNETMKAVRTIRAALSTLLPTLDNIGLVQETPSKPIDYLKTLEDQCWDLRCVAEPTAGGDDADVAWNVVGHWMSQPQERVIGYGRTPQEAIKDAMRPRDYEGSLLDEEDTAARVVAPWPAREYRPTFQSRVATWMDSCFGPVISADKVERNHRFLEEALELVQALGCSREDCLQLVDYVFGRPVGEPSQEVGGVMVTLAALCLASGLDMDAVAETELARVWTKIDVIRAKQAAKPRGSALPISPSYPTDN